MFNEPPPRFWCPVCGKELIARQEVEEVRWPAGAPKTSPYVQKRAYTIRSCENGHRLAQEGGILRGMDSMAAELAG